MVHWRTTLLLTLLTLLAAATGYNYFFQPFAQLQAEPEVTIAEPEVVPAWETWQDNLSARDKAAQLLAAPVLVDNQGIATAAATPATEAARISQAWLGQYNPGFITIFGSDISLLGVSRLNQQLNVLLAEVPLAVAIDHEGGDVQRLSGVGFSVVPSWQELCALSEEERRVAFDVIAEEVAQAEVDVVFGPVVDYADNHPVMRSRICDADSQKVATVAGELVSAYKQQGVLPVIKHFPGIGATRRDLHRTFDRVEVTPEDAEVYRAILDQHPEIGVMTSHVGVENQFPEVPCSLSRPCVNQLEQLYPEALRFSDALEMDAAGHTERGAILTLEERSIAAISAGNDVLVFGPSVTQLDLQRVIQHIATAYEQDPVFAERVDTAVLRILQWKAERYAE